MLKPVRSSTFEIVMILKIRIRRGPFSGPVIAAAVITRIDLHHRKSWSTYKKVLEEIEKNK